MTTVESPQIQVTSYDDTSKKVPEQDDFDKELESFIETRKSEESKVRTPSGNLPYNLAITDSSYFFKTNDIGNYRLLLLRYSVWLLSFRKSKQLGFICLSVWKFERILMLFKWRVTLLSNRKCSCSSFNHSRRIFQLPSWLISW